MEWWYNNSGQNLLSGVEGDENNPPRLSQEMIADFIRLIPAARESFNRIVPTMTEAEQIRLNFIASGYAAKMMPDRKKLLDDFQARQNKAGIRTTGPRGGHY